MKRLAAAALLLCVLGCAGAVPAMARRELRAVSIDTLDGAITDQRDLGSEGALDASWALWNQRLSWDPLDGETIEETARALVESFAAVNGGAAPAPSPFEDDVVDGQAAVTFAMSADGALLLVTTWLCPAAGVRFKLMTSGLGPTVRSLHERALASARCGAEPVGLDAAARTWAFVGDGGVWVADGEGVDVGRWVRRDERVFLEVSATPAMRDPAYPNLCRDTLSLIRERLRSEYTLDDGSGAVWAERPDGCRHDWVGERADGAVHRGRITHHVCADDRGYVVRCVVEPGAGELGAVCDGAFRCVSPP